jgi:2-polyprenyl-3-methyl-5-hydroxy-6-metoxy-1,4-benzoquinol methylase
MYKNCIELVKLDCNTLLSTVNSHITKPQQTAAIKGNAIFLYIVGSACYHLSFKYFL